MAVASEDVSPSVHQDQDRDTEQLSLASFSSSRVSLRGPGWYPTQDAFASSLSVGFSGACVAHLGFPDATDFLIQLSRGLDALAHGPVLSPH